MGGREEEGWEGHRLLLSIKKLKVHSILGLWNRHVYEGVLSFLQSSELGFSSEVFDLRMIF